MKSELVNESALGAAVFLNFLVGVLEIIHLFEGGSVCSHGRVAKIAFHAGFLDYLCGNPVKEIHIGKGGRAAGHHFRHGEHTRPINAVFVPLRLKGEDFFGQPALKG